MAAINHCCETCEIVPFLAFYDWRDEGEPRLVEIGVFICYQDLDSILETTKRFIDAIGPPKDSRILGEYRSFEWIISRNVISLMHVAWSPSSNVSGLSSKMKQKEPVGASSTSIPRTVPEAAPATTSPRSRTAIGPIT
jgi:hypothetical protein